MWGLLPGTGALQKRFVNLGMHAADLPEGRLHASFMHLYFPSNPHAVAALFAPS
jgi:cobyrinic acid a,c-diamide synthase